MINRIKKEEAELRKQAVKTAKETSIKKIAKQMKQKGYAIKDITELTGLTEADIKRL